MTQITTWLVTGFVGATIGSFLNVCIHRWPANQSVVRPRSRCPDCGQFIAWYDNLPVLSYILLRARCRNCKAPISIRYPLVEAGTAAIWLGMLAQHGFALEALRGAVFFTLLLGIAIIDARHKIIPDHFSLGGAVAGLLLAAISPEFSLGSGALGAAVGYGAMRLVAIGGEKLFRKPALGLGDVHMMAMVGAFLGVMGTLATVFLGSLFALLIGVPLAWWRSGLTLLGTYLPLGTFLALGAAVAYLWGDALLAWYMSTLSGGAVVGY